MYEIRSLGDAHLKLFAELKAQVAFSDFCCSAGTIHFSAYNGFLTNSLILFSLSYKGYEIEAKVRDGMVFINRNGLYQHSSQYNGKERCEVVIQWNVDSIGCGIRPPAESAKPMEQQLRFVQTPITLPPAELVQILRTENLLVNSAFRDVDQLFVTVLDCLHLCEADIRRHGGERFIWGKGGDVDKPLDEPEISGYFAAFLASHGAARNFDVTCESVAGSGKLDFYIVAPIEGAGLGKIAIEAKKADSNQIKHGFSVQLREYMERIGTNYGIYLVYWLKSPRYPFPAQATFGQLQVELLNPLQRPLTVRDIGVDLSIGAVPSRK